jgi:hypothetical protein
MKDDNMAKSRIGTPEQCEAFSDGTDSGTEGWWFHGCSMHDAEQITGGEQVWRGAREFCFTRDPRGADQDHGGAVVRSMLHIQKPPDRYYFEDCEITAGYRWIKLYDASCIMFDSTYIGSSDTGEQLVPNN